MSMELMQRSRSGVQIIDDVEKTARIADILKAVAHPLRLRIVSLLCQGDWQVNALADRLGAPPAIVSQQLRILRLHRLVIAEPAAGYVTYRLREPRLRDLVNCMEHCSLP
jgi:DNA-binding transcriptional ArsR family regulator